MSEQDLRNTQRAYERAAERAETARIQRDNAVRDALAAGWTHAAIARATGLTRGRIGQMAQANKEQQT